MSPNPGKNPIEFLPSCGGPRRVGTAVRPSQGEKSIEAITKSTNVRAKVFSMKWMPKNPTTNCLCLCLGHVGSVLLVKCTPIGRKKTTWNHWRQMCAASLPTCSVQVALAEGHPAQNEENGSRMCTSASTMAPWQKNNLDVQQNARRSIWWLLDLLNWPRKAERT